MQREGIPKWPRLEKIVNLYTKGDHDPSNQFEPERCAKTHYRRGGGVRILAVKEVIRGHLALLRKGTIWVS